jgi:hypothetical protein
MRWKGKVDPNINLALGSKDVNVECGAATQWERPVWLWRRVGGKVVQTDFTQFVLLSQLELKGCLLTFGSVQHAHYGSCL